jgi:hypothetical protein
MTITNQTNPIGSNYESKRSAVFIAQKDGGLFGKSEKIYTSTRLTKISNTPGPNQYRVEVFQHDSPSGGNSTQIGTVVDGKLVLNSAVDYGNAFSEDSFRLQVEAQIKNQKKDAEKQIKDKLNSDSESIFVSEELKKKGITEDDVENGLGTQPLSDLEELQNRKGGIGRGGKNTYGALFYPSFIEKSVQDKLKVTILEFAPKKKRTKMAKVEKKTTEWTTAYNQIPTISNTPVYAFPMPSTTTELVDVEKDVFKDQFSFNSRKRMEFGKRTLGHITLPIPDGVSDMNKVNFGDGNLNPVQALLADDVTSALMGEKVTGVNFNNELKKTFESTKKFKGEVKEAIGGFFSAKTLGMDKDELIARTQGRIFNNNLELLFKGPTLRTFNFRFKMSPRDESEIKQVMKIIRAFKQSSAVQKSKTGIFMVTPNTYKLEFKKGGRGLGNKNHLFLPKVKECALLQIAVDYMPEGSYMTYENEDPSAEGSMVTYVMTLSFQELEPLFNDDYFAEGGVGF